MKGRHAKDSQTATQCGGRIFVVSCVIIYHISTQAVLTQCPPDLNCIRPSMEIVCSMNYEKRRVISKETRQTLEQHNIHVRNVLAGIEGCGCEGSVGGNVDDTRGSRHILFCFGIVFNSLIV